MSPEKADKDDLISRYLLGQLEGDELRDFSLKMMRDKAFRAEVDANRLLMKALWQTGKSEEISPVSESNTSNFKRFLIGGLMLVAIFVGGFLFFSKSEKPVILKPKIQELIPESIPEKEVIKTFPEEKIIEESPKEVPVKNTPQKQKPTIKPVEPQKENRRSPTIKFAANFNPNPLLEEEIEDQVRGNKLPKLSLTVSPANTKIDFSDKNVRLTFEGKIASEKSAQALAFQLSFFNNKIENYQNWNPLWEHHLTLKTTNEHEFSFDLNENLPAEPGLYYFVFKDLKTGRFLEIGKVEIGY